MTKISAYTALTLPASSDVLPVVDVSDTSMAASGTTKKIAVSDLASAATGNVLNAAYAGGADPTGSADSAPAFAAARTAAQAAGGVIRIPAGTYRIDSNPFAPGAGGPFSVAGDGISSTTIRPSATFSGSYALDLQFGSSAPGVQLRDFFLDMTAAPAVNGIRIGNTAAAQTHRALIQNIRTSYGATAITIEGGTVIFTLRNIYMQNMTVSGLRITNSNATAQPNGDIDNVVIVNTDVAVSTAQGVLIDCFTTGITMTAVRVQGTTGGASPFSAGIVYNTAAPTGGNGAFIQAVNCITDAITGPGLSLTNCRQFQSANNFWSCLAGTANYGVNLSGGTYFRFTNDMISGCGVNYAATPDDISFTNCEFPYTGTVPGVHKMTSAPTGLQVSRESLSGRNAAGYQLTDNLATFYGALTSPAEIGAVPVQITANGPIFENIDFRVINGNATALVSGNVYLFRIPLPRGLPVTNITWCSGSTPLTAGTSIHYWTAIYAASAGVGSGAPLAQSTDNTAPTIAASTIQPVPLSAPYVTTASGYYYLALSLTQTGGTMPSAMNFAGISALTNTTPKQGYVYATGYNSGTAPTLAGGGAGSLANTFWMGVS